MGEWPSYFGIGSRSVPAPGVPALAANPEFISPSWFRTSAPATPGQACDIGVLPTRSLGRQREARVVSVKPIEVGSPPEPEMPSAPFSALMGFCRARVRAAKDEKWNNARADRYEGIDRYLRAIVRKSYATFDRLRMPHPTYRNLVAILEGEMIVMT